MVPKCHLVKAVLLWSAHQYIAHYGNWYGSHSNDAYFDSQVICIEEVTPLHDGCMKPCTCFITGQAWQKICDAQRVIATILHKTGRYSDTSATNNCSRDKTTCTCDHGYLGNTTRDGEGKPVRRAYFCQVFQSYAVNAYCERHNHQRSKYYPPRLDHTLRHTVSILTDDGTQIASRYLATLSPHLGSENLTTTTYHPQTNRHVDLYNKLVVMRLHHYIADHRGFLDEFFSCWPIHTTRRSVGPSTPHPSASLWHGTRQGRQQSTTSPPWRRVVIIRPNLRTRAAIVRTNQCFTQPCKYKNSSGKTSVE